MPSSPPSAFTINSVSKRSRGGHARHTLVWALTVASVVLILPVLLLESSRTVPTAEAWLKVNGARFSPIQFEAAPALVIDLNASLAWPSDEESFSSEPFGEDNPAADYDALRWFDNDAPPLRSTVGPNHFQYKLDPEFGFQDRDLHLNGMMIRLRIEF